MNVSEVVFQMMMQTLGFCCQIVIKVINASWSESLLGRNFYRLTNIIFDGRSLGYKVCRRYFVLDNPGRNWYELVQAMHTGPLLSAHCLFDTATGGAKVRNFQTLHMVSLMNTVYQPLLNPSVMKNVYFPLTSNNQAKLS